MAGENLVSFQFTDEEVAQLDNALSVFEAAAKKLIEVSQTDRMEIAKMTKKGFQFINKSIDIMNISPDLVPRFVDVENVKTDVALLSQLQRFLLPLQAITRRIEDTMMVTGSEAYLGCLSTYQSIKNAAKGNVASARVHYDELKQFFPGPSRSTATETTTTAATPN